jgi:hypothetical protein
MGGAARQQTAASIENGSLGPGLEMYIVETPLVQKHPE